LFLTITEAPERTAPVASDTVPESGAVVPLWPRARKLFNARKLVMARSLSKDGFIQNLLPRVVLGLFIEGVASSLFTVMPIGNRQAVKVRV
jgi:hypothetical protein